MALPTFEQIEKMPDWQIKSIIRSGESINWDIRLTETTEEVDDYVSTLYRELEIRGLTLDE